MALDAGSAVRSQLAEMTLLDSDGANRRLASFWAENPVVFVWLRHYG